MFNRKIGTISKKIHTPYEGMFGLGGTTTYVKEVTGTRYIDLTYAVANELLELKVYGGTEQNGTPTPTTPVNIVCNNGVIKVRHQSGLPLSYQAVEYIKNDANSYIDTGYKANLSTKAVIEFAIDHEQPSSNTGVFGDRVNDNIQAFYLATKTGTKLYAQFDSVARQIIVDPAYTPNQKYTSTLSKDGWYLDETLCATFNNATSFTTENNLLLFKAGTLSQSGVLIYKMTLYENDVIVHNYIPAKNSSNVLGMYDTATGNFLTNAGTGTFTAGNPVSDELEIYTAGTTETIEDSLGNTATAEMLLKVGDYTDEQEILDGDVTRNVGVLVLTGTEEWNSSTLTNCYSLSTSLGAGTFTNRRVICTHFQASDTLPDANARQGYALIGNKAGEYTIGFGATTQFATDTAWNNWLASQYANGTPVIVVYPLATPTTESVAGQTMNIQKGNNTIEITQASIDNLQLYAKYKSTKQ